jgi:hypothetical protein
LIDFNIYGAKYKYENKREKAFNTPKNGKTHQKTHRHTKKKSLKQNDQIFFSSDF